MNILRNLGFADKFTTGQWSSWWKNRQIDWKVHYLDSWKHPHRELISRILSTMPWACVYEVGCGAGANLVNIATHFPKRLLGGCDVNPDAIKLASEQFNGGIFHVGGADDIMMSDNSVDIVLTDMCLIYVGDIHTVIEEIKRIARKSVVLCELHTSNPLDRLFFKLRSGYWAHDYKKLLTKHGFKDIRLIKIPPEAWENGEPQKTYGYFILANLPPRK
jgi:ubiquinone/menaquinone biosynthesis C-methylase UbiE